jgi:hypothetical protein
MCVGRRLGRGDRSNLKVGHLGFDTGGYLVADGRRVVEDFDRVRDGRYRGGQVAYEELFATDRAAILKAMNQAAYAGPKQRPSDDASSWHVAAASRARSPRTVAGTSGRGWWPRLPG